MRSNAEYLQLASFLQAVPNLMLEYKRSKEHGLERTTIDHNGIVDREWDGNPFVTAETLTFQATIQSEVILNYYIERFQNYTVISFNRSF